MLALPGLGNQSAGHENTSHITGGAGVGGDGVGAGVGGDGVLSATASTGAVQ